MAFFWNFLHSTSKSVINFFFKLAKIQTIYNIKYSWTNWYLLITANNRYFKEDKNLLDRLNAHSNIDLSNLHPNDQKHRFLNSSSRIAREKNKTRPKNTAIEYRIVKLVYFPCDWIDNEISECLGIPRLLTTIKKNRIHTTTRFKQLDLITHSISLFVIVRLFYFARITAKKYGNNHVLYCVFDSNAGLFQNFFFERGSVRRWAGGLESRSMASASRVWPF